jgi:hypothetical protein
MSTAMPTDTITKIARKTRSAMIGSRAGREEISRETDESEEVYQRLPGGGELDGAKVKRHRLKTCTTRRQP